MTAKIYAPLIITFKVVIMVGVIKQVLICVATLLLTA